jgi:hypothetical protein
MSLDLVSAHRRQGSPKQPSPQTFYVLVTILVRLCTLDAAGTGEMCVECHLIVKCLSVQFCKGDRSTHIPSACDIPSPLDTRQTPISDTDRSLTSGRLADNQRFTDGLSVVVGKNRPILLENNGPVRQSLQGIMKSARLHARLYGAGTCTRRLSYS